MQDNQHIYLYIHYFGTPHSRIILNEIISAIVSSELWLHVEKIVLVTAGDPLFFPSLNCLATLYPRLHVIINSRWSEGSEVDTLGMLHRHATDLPANSIIAYFHTKGAVNYTQISQDWLTYMIDYNIYGWRKAVKCLHRDGYDTYGTSWCYADFSFDPACIELHGKRNGHYQGNFWWTTQSYLNKVTPPRNNCCRYEAEAWIGMANPRFYNAMCAPYSLNLASYRREQYMKYHQYSSKDLMTVEIPELLFERLKGMHPDLFKHDIDNLTFDENRAGVSWSATSYDFTNAIEYILGLGD